jgi:diguanylate cyclase (GGDEF)-like protein/PAS domain S-box-containing protein
MVKAKNYVFTECIEKFVRINNAELALGFMINSADNKKVLDLDSKLVVSNIKLPEKKLDTIFADLESHFLNRSLPLKECFFTDEHHYIANSKLINNIRYIPINEGENLLAVILLANIKTSHITKSLPDITPFLLASISLLKNQKQRNINALTPTKPNTKHSEKNLLLSLFKNTFHPTFIFDEDFKVLQANSASQRLFNTNMTRGWLPIDKLIKKYIPSIALNILTTISKYSFLGHLNKEQWNDIEFKHSFYKSITVDIHLFNINYMGEQCFGLMLNEKNSSKQETHDNFSSLQRFNALTSVVPMAILQVDKLWNCEYVNETWHQYTGQSKFQSQGQGWLNCLSKEDIQQVLPDIHRVTSHSKNYNGELQLRKSNGGVLWVSIHAISLFNDKYELTGSILTIHDISENYLYAEKLEKMANYDHLTGLSNRSFFTERLNNALIRSKNHGITALMFLDLDKFKQINDTLGHPVGDKVIQEVATRLSATIKNDDAIARLGGDEFAIILTDLKTVDAIAAIAKNIVDDISLPLTLENHPIAMSCSIGIAITNERDHTPSATDMLNQADLALYKAKDSGRNQFYFYDSELEKNTIILSALRSSLTSSYKNEFSVLFQPQINSISKEIIGFEALSRWNSRTLGLVEPDIFIALIEENNLINEFSAWLFKEVASIVKQWHTLNLLTASQRIAINVSAKQLLQPTFADSLIALFNLEKASPEWFSLEVTETAFISNPETVSQNLKRLQDTGFLIALDDFGTGYSSLNLLRKMPLDYIKIDRSFVDDILDDNDSANIVETIITLCKVLNLDVIAEGVENLEIKNWLSSHDCLHQQGFLYFKPLKCTEAESLLINEKKTNDKPT